MNDYMVRKNKYEITGDFYETPEWATEALFSKEVFNGSVWEPAEGNGAMVRVINKHNTCYGTDIQSGTNFLTTTPTEVVENIITNPPYSLAQKFVLTARLLATKKVAMLLKLTFLEGMARKKMFEATDFPLKAVYVFSKRVQMYISGQPKPKNSSMLAYAWYVWDKSYQAKATLGWI